MANLQSRLDNIEMWLNINKTCVCQTGMPPVATKSN